jgi:predicted ATPase
MSAFLAEQLGAPTGNGLLNLVHRVSKGNPRLALELVSDWRKEERLKFLEKEGCWEFLGGKWSGQLPNSALTYIRQVLRSLSSPAQVLLTLAALVGPTFSFEILRQVVLNRPDGAGWWIDLDKTKLGQSLIEITGAGLIEEYNTEYRFVYPLLAEALPAILPHSQRQCWKEVISWARIQGSGGRG